MTSDMHEEDVAGSASFGRHDPGEAVATPAARPAQAVPADSEAPRIAGNVLHRSMLPLPSARDHVVAIIAPSGYGKTTLAVQWFHESMAHGTASWMQIDERCRDPAVFLRRLNEAMNIAWHGLPGNFQGAEDHDSAMTALLSELHRRSKRQLLFVDDDQTVDAKRGDLLKMHAYRDAIRRSSGAYVLYPGNEPRVMRQHHEVLPGLGAFPFVPGSDGHASVGAVREFLEELLDHVATQASNRERAAFWTDVAHDGPSPQQTDFVPLDRPPADTSVLLGYCQSAPHRD